MVRFEKDKVIIEIATEYPAETWTVAMRDLLTGISLIRKDMVPDNDDCIYGMCELLQHMLPDGCSFQKMLKLKETIESGSRKTK